MKFEDFVILIVVNFKFMATKALITLQLHLVLDHSTFNHLHHFNILKIIKI